jgi:hypothetical protein
LRRFEVFFPLRIDPGFEAVLPVAADDAVLFVPDDAVVLDLEEVFGADAVVCASP